MHTQSQPTVRKVTIARFTTLILAAAAAPSLAATYTFIPSAGSTPSPSGTADWNDASNWVNTSGSTTGTLPGSGDVAGSATGATTVIDASVPTINDLRFANAVAGATVASPGGTAVPSTADATLEVRTGGSINIYSLNGSTNGNALFGRAQPSGGHLVIDGGTLTTGVIQGQAITNDAAGSVVIGDIAGTNSGSSGAANSTLDISTGTLASGNNLILGNSFATVSGTPYFATGTATQTGGTVNVAGAVQIGAFGRGSYTISAGALNQLGTNPDGSTLGRDAFFVGRNANGTGNAGASGTFVQSGTAAVSIANGLYIANNNNTTGSYTVSGGTLAIAGEIKVGASTNSTGTTTATNNVGTFRIVGHTTPTIFANRLTANTANSTLGFTIGDASGTTLLDLVGGNGFDGSAVLSTATHIDVDPADGFTPSATASYELLRATSIAALPTLVLDGDAFDAGILSIQANSDGTQSLVLSVPEPASLAALLGLGGLALRRRERR